MALTPQQRQLLTWGSHERCMTEECEEITQHKTGKCNKCRTHRCSACGSGFVSTSSIMPQKPKCALCSRAKKKFDRFEPDEEEFFKVRGFQEA